MKPSDWTSLQAEVDDPTLTRSEALARPQDRPWPDTYEPVVSPKPVVDRWRDRAACRGMATSVFFPEPSPTEGRQGRSIDYSTARQVCDGCPVRQQCLDEALLHHASDGMWGGLSPRQRKSEVSRRGGLRARVCEVCGAEFLANGRSYYCDETCRATARRRQNLESKRRTA